MKRNEPYFSLIIQFKFFVILSNFPENKLSAIVYNLYIYKYNILCQLLWRNCFWCEESLSILSKHASRCRVVTSMANYKWLAIRKLFLTQRRLIRLRALSRKPHKRSDDVDAVMLKLD